MARWKANLLCLACMGIWISFVFIGIFLSYYFVGDLYLGFSIGTFIGVITACIVFSYVWWIRPKSKKKKNLIQSPYCRIPVDKITHICPQCGIEKKF